MFENVVTDLKEFKTNETLNRNVFVLYYEGKENGYLRNNDEYTKKLSDARIFATKQAATQKQNMRAIDSPRSIVLPLKCKLGK